MTKRTKKPGQGKFTWLVFLSLFSVGLLITVLVRGHDVVLLNPKGLIAQEQKHLMLFVTATLLTIAIPTLLLFYFFAWKYRESNNKATYDATTHHGKFFTFSLWAIPTLVVLVLTSHMWPAAHNLDPPKAIATNAEPMTIQVIALRWKWLFIYPDQNIASVNFVQIPVDTPVQFELTADEAPMNSFWIPHLGGQLYAMTGHDNRLNLMADAIGDYNGGAAEINGDGFAGMKFVARASTKEYFALWMQALKQYSPPLDSTQYNRLLRASQNSPVTYYSEVEPNLYENVLAKYGTSLHDHTDHVHTETE